MELRLDFRDDVGHLSLDDATFSNVPEPSAPVPGAVGFSPHRLRARW
jgi:hypothetical protein